EVGRSLIPQALRRFENVLEVHSESRMKPKCIATIMILLACFSVRAQQPFFADVVVVHGKVWTVDPQRPQAEAVAIHGSRIIALGSDADIAKWIGPATKKIDAQGKTVLPGFIDFHVHFSTGGGETSGVHLRDANTPQEFARRIGEH